MQSSSHYLELCKNNSVKDFEEKAEKTFCGYIQKSKELGLIFFVTIIANCV